MYLGSISIASETDPAFCARMVRTLTMAAGKRFFHSVDKLTSVFLKPTQPIGFPRPFSGGPVKLLPVEGFHQREPQMVPVVDLFEVEVSVLGIGRRFRNEQNASALRAVSCRRLLTPFDRTHCEDSDKATWALSCGAGARI